nr:hypothetical protein [Klebsiella pneumoniae subsp. pneumoniae]
MKRLARLSLRLRLTLLFAVPTTAAWDGQRYRGSRPAKSWISCSIPSSCCSLAA